MCMTGGSAKGGYDVGRMDGTGGMDPQEKMRVSDGMSALGDLDSVGHWAKAVGSRSAWKRGKINRLAILGVLLLSPPNTDQSGFRVSRWG